MAYRLRVPHLSASPPLRAGPRLEGRILGGCRLLWRLHVGDDGGAGAVYLAQQIYQDNRVVAVKVVRPEKIASGPQGVAYVTQRFMQEGAVLRRLVHPGILPSYTSGLEDGWLYLVMQYAPDGSLADALAVGGRHRLRLPVHLTCATDLIDQMAAAVQFLHQRGIAHRALKPGNVLVQIQPDGHWRLLLADFGIARALASERHAGQASLATHTATYLAPEQLSDGFSPAGDEYALGTLAYLLLAGRMPVESEATERANGLCHPSPPPLRSLNRAVPLELAEVVGHALATDPVNRWPSVAAFAQAFRWGASAGSAALMRTSSVRPVLPTTGQPAQHAGLVRAPDDSPAPTPDTLVREEPAPPTLVSVRLVVPLTAPTRHTDEQTVTWPSMQRRVAPRAVRLTPRHVRQEGRAWREWNTWREWRPAIFSATVALLLLALVAAVQITPSAGSSRVAHTAPTATSGSRPTVRPATATHPPAALDKAQVTPTSSVLQVVPGQRVIYRFTFRNTGTTTWSTNGGYRFSCDIARHPPASCSGFNQISFGRATVAPGAQIHFRVSFIAPSRPGAYESWWNLEHGATVFATPDAHVSLIVRSPPRSTRAPAVPVTPRPKASPKPVPTTTPGPRPTSIPKAKPTPAATATPHQPTPSPRPQPTSTPQSQATVTPAKAPPTPSPTAAPSPTSAATAPPAATPSGT
jgi:serine/threonine protein kinase